jgi:phosphoribosylamine-glycine ligase
VPKVGDVEDLINDAEVGRDVFIFDVSGSGVIADFLSTRGFPVLGGSILADRLERDRCFGYAVMAESDIEIPETKSFTSFEKAQEFVTKNSAKRWVYKPSKLLGDLSCSHVSYDAEDMLRMLRSVERDTDLATPEFELQAFEEGVALSTELWFQRGQLVEQLVNHTLERKELMNGDIGPSGGCMGNLTWFCEGCRVCDVAKQLVPWCQAQGYHGMLDLNAIVAKRKIYGLEFTPRFGYDATPTLLFELVRAGLGEFLEAAAGGQIGGIDVRSGFAGGVRVTIPPWPTEKHQAESDIPIRGLTDNEIRDTYWYNVKRSSEDNSLVTAGAWGIVGLFNSHSSDPRRALDKPLDVIDRLKLKNKQYRTDLGKVFAQDLDKLEELGVDVNVYASEQAR